MITITDNAIEKLKEFVEPWEVVRLAVEGGGCNGFQYRFGVQSDEEVEESDHITKAANGVRLCIDFISYGYLENVEIDFRDEIDDMLDEIDDEQQKRLLTNESGPNKDDTIH